jgi:hypothetical protein
MCQSLAEGGRRCAPHMNALVNSKQAEKVIANLNSSFPPGAGVRNISDGKAALRAALLAGRETTAGISPQALLARATIQAEGYVAALKDYLNISVSERYATLAPENATEATVDGFVWDWFATQKFDVNSAWSAIRNPITSPEAVEWAKKNQTREIRTATLRHSKALQLTRDEYAEAFNDPDWVIRAAAADNFPNSPYRDDSNMMRVMKYLAINDSNLAVRVTAQQRCHDEDVTRQRNLDATRPSRSAPLNGEYVQLIQEAVEELDTPERRERYRTGDFPRSDRVEDLNRRYVWDLAHAAKVHNWLPKWATDDVRETALRKAIPPL